MIDEKICRQVVVIGTSPDGKGGVSTVIGSQSRMMSPFQFIAIHRNGLGKFILPLSGLFKCLRYLPSQYKIAHVHSSSYSDFYRSAIFMLVMKLMGKRVVMHMHGAKFKEFYAGSPRIVKFVCRHVDAIATVSNNFVNFMQQNGLNSTVFYLPNSIADTTPPPGHGNPDKLTLSYFGALNSRKGIFETVEAIGRRHNDFKGKIELLIGGTGDEARLRELIDSYGLKETVRYFGWLDEEGKHRLLSHSDVFVHPSRFESFGISILEAMNYSLPIITTDTGGIPDLVTNGENGIIVSPDEPDTIADAIEWMLLHKDERRALGEKSALRAQQFHASKIEKRLADIYGRLLN